MWTGWRWRPEGRAVLRDLQHSDAKVRIRALEAVAARQSSDLQVLEALRRCLTDSDWSVRRAAALCAGEIEDRESEPRLLELLSDSVPTVQEAAVMALGRVGSEQTIERLKDLIARGGELVRAQAAVSLAELVGKEAAPNLIEALRDDEARVRWSAVAALGDVEARETADEVAGLLDDPDARVRFDAAYTLARFDDGRGVSVLGEYTTDRYWAFMCCEALGRLGDQSAVEPLTRAWKSFWQHPFVRVRAAASLAVLGVAEARLDLIRRARGFRASARGLALELLGEVGGTDVLPVLLSALERGRSPIGAARGLGKLGDRVAIEPLKTALARASLTTDHELANELREALRRLEPDGEPE